MSAGVSAQEETGPDSQFTVEGQLCFALHSASRAMTAAYRGPLAEVGLTYTQYVVLLALWDDEPREMRDLSALLHLDSATLSPLLRRMEDQDLVVRRRLPSDERVVEVWCTERGRSLREPVRLINRRVLAETQLDGQDLAQLREQLHALASRLRAAGGTG